MKQIALTLAALFAAASVLAQGTVNFATFIPGSVDAPVRYQGVPGQTDGDPVGNNFWGQLMAGPVGGPLQLVGDPVEFRQGTGQGYITAGGVIEIPGVAAGAAADVRLVAWDKALGMDYNAAIANPGGGVWGQSEIVTIASTGGQVTGEPTPRLPANLTGLQGFNVTFVPEPSMALLGLLGIGLLLVRRKK
jgi:hypothetical protein